jgi:hypothetical protein
LTVAGRRGGFTPGPRTLSLRLHLASPPKAVLLDGRDTSGWRWDAEHRAAVLRWDDDGKAHEVIIQRN